MNAESVDPPRMTEEPASQEEQPTQVPAAVNPTPEAADVPEDTSAPDPVATEEATAAPEMTDAPEATDLPEATETPEPTEFPDPLVVSVAAAVRSAFADGDAMDVSQLMEGGVPEYTITYQGYLDGAEVANDQPLLTMENASDTDIGSVVGVNASTSYGTGTVTNC